jgi:hypothetical protein
MQKQQWTFHFKIKLNFGQVKNDCIGPELLTDLSTSRSVVVILSSLRDKVMIHVQGRRTEFIVFHSPLFIRLFYAKFYQMKR